MKRFLKYFTTFEKLLWCASVLMITVSFIIFDRSNFLTLAASIIGVTSLIFIAKGNPIGQIMMIIFSLFYGWISFSYAYYGEIFTYLGMSLPMAAVTLVSWLKHPYEGKKSEVEVSSLSKGKKIIMVILTVVVTAAELCRGIPDLLPKPILRPRLRLQRHCADCALGYGEHKRAEIHLGCSLLYRVFVQRLVRLFQLEQDEKTANGEYRDKKIIILEFVTVLSVSV